VTLIKCVVQISLRNAYQMFNLANWIAFSPALCNGISAYSES